MLPEKYLMNPCAASSIPYWKAMSITVPSGMMILHQDDYKETEHGSYVDEPYFRMIHNLENISAPVLRHGFTLYDATLMDYVAHINQCYNGIGITEAELQGYTARPVYDAALWLAVIEDQTGEIVATGIGELDREICEGILEWVQVSERCRGCGLGSYVVSELLWRMKGRANFATVSGQCNAPSVPERLYRRCGFTGSDVWHILRKRKS